MTKMKKVTKNTEKALKSHSKSLTLLLLTLASTTLSLKPPNYKCSNYISERQEFYNINKLTRVQTEPYQINQVNLVYQSGGQSTPGFIVFNVCTFQTKVDPNYSCQTDLNAVAWFLYDNQGGGTGCIALTSEFQLNNANTNWTYVPYPEKGGGDGYILQADNDALAGGQNTFPFTVVFDFKCDGSAGGNPIDLYAQQNSTSNTLTIGLSSGYACGRKALGPIADLLQNKWLICLFCIAFGVVVAPWGFKFFRPALIIVSFTLS